MSETMTLLDSVARQMMDFELGHGCYDSARDWAEAERGLWRVRANIALRALGVTEEQMAGPADAVVVVPVEATREMAEAAGGECVSLERADDPSYEPRQVWAEMISARPGAPE